MYIARAILLIAIMLIATCPLLACQGNLPIEQAVICSEINKDGSPKLPAVSFSPDVKTVYCSVKLAAVSNTSTIRGEWYIVSSAEGDLKEYFAGGESIKADKPFVVFAFVRADQLLPVGDYEVRLTYDNKQHLAVPFKVQGDAAVAGVKLSEAVICSSIDTGTDQPLDRWDTVPDNAGIVLCSVKVAGADFGTVITAQWFYLKGEFTDVTDKLIAQGSTKVEGRKYVSFSIRVAEGKKMVKGDYQVKLFVNGALQATAPFKVVDSTEIPGPYLSEAAVFVMGGSENRTMEIKNSFSSSIEAVTLRVKANNCKPGTEVGIKWVVETNAEGDILDYKAQEDSVKPEGTMELFSALKRKSDEFPRGQYAVKVSLNGVEKIVVPFQVK